jgi:hypothetical protein
MHTAGALASPEALMHPNAVFHRSRLTKEEVYLLRAHASRKAWLFRKPSAGSFFIRKIQGNIRMNEEKSNYEEDPFSNSNKPP